MKLLTFVSPAVLLAAAFGAQPVLADDASTVMLVTPSGLGSVAVNVTQTVNLPSEVITATNVAAINAPFTDLSGGAGMNAASGAFNAQSNVIVMSSAGLANVVATLTQRTGPGASAGTGALLTTGGSNSATIGGSALAGSVGAVGANVAAGVGNLQSNVIIVAH